MSNTLQPGDSLRPTIRVGLTAQEPTGCDIGMCVSPIHYPCQRTQKIFWVSKTYSQNFQLEELGNDYKSFQWGSNKPPGPSCFELYQYGEYCTSTFCALWPWNLTDDVEQGKSEGFDSCDWPCNLAQIWSKSSIFQPVWPWNLMDDLGKQ